MQLQKGYRSVTKELQWKQQSNKRPDTTRFVGQVFTVLYAEELRRGIRGENRNRPAIS